MVIFLKFPLKTRNKVGHLAQEAYVGDIRSMDSYI
jgi:hypothetical protein